MAEEMNVDLEDLDLEDEKLDANGYVQKLREIKKDYVPREKYNELQLERKTLSDALLEGLTDTDGTPEVASRSDLLKRRDIISKRLKDTELHRTNLDIAKDALELRDLCIKLDGKAADIFTPKGVKIKANNADYEAADRVAQVFKECIEYAKDDPALFTQELMRRTDDANPYYEGPEI